VSQSAKAWQLELLVYNAPKGRESQETKPESKTSRDSGSRVRCGNKRSRGKIKKQDGSISQGVLGKGLLAPWLQSEDLGETGNIELGEGAAGKCPV